MQAQKVTFLSEGFEFGVKAHLGLSESDEVMQAQTDTITSIDLSGLGISEISDVVYLPNVEKLDLSLNEIDDVEPLASLEHLQQEDADDKHRSKPLSRIADFRGDVHEARPLPFPSRA